MIKEKNHMVHTKPLSCVGLLHHKFIIQFAGEFFFETGEH